MSANANARSATIKSYLYPTAIILTVFIGSVYGANLKQANQVNSIGLTLSIAKIRARGNHEIRQRSGGKDT